MNNLKEFAYQNHKPMGLLFLFSLIKSVEVLIYAFYVIINHFVNIDNASICAHILTLGW